jgi:LGFP repeat-containing protein
MKRMVSTLFLVLALAPLAHAQDAMLARVDALRAILGADVGQERISVRGGRVREFQNGSVYWSPNNGARLVSFALAKYRELGAEEGGLGYPVGDEQWGPAGMSQLFEHGLVRTTNLGELVAEVIPEAKFTESSITLSGMTGAQLAIQNGMITAQSLFLPESALKCSCVGGTSQRLGFCEAVVSSDKKSAQCKVQVQCSGSCQFSTSSQ